MIDFAATCLYQMFGARILIDVFDQDQTDAVS